MHVAEIPEELAYSRATRGATTIRHLGRLGVLGPRFLAVHATWADDEEIELMAATATSVSHNAASNLKILGVPRWRSGWRPGSTWRWAPMARPPTTA